MQPHPYSPELSTVPMPALKLTTRYSPALYEPELVPALRPELESELAVASPGNETPKTGPIGVAVGLSLGGLLAVGLAILLWVCFLQRSVLGKWARRMRRESRMKRDDGLVGKDEGTGRGEDGAYWRV